MAKSLKSQLKTAKSLEDRASKNISVSHKTSSGTEVIKAGQPLDHTVKHIPYANTQFGMSLGSTINMDNYESLRVDVWLTDSVQEGETISEAYTRVQDVLEKQIETVVAQYK